MEESEESAWSYVNKNEVLLTRRELPSPVIHAETLQCQQQSSSWNKKGARETNGIT